MSLWITEQVDDALDSGLAGEIESDQRLGVFIGDHGVQQEQGRDAGIGLLQGIDMVEEAYDLVIRVNPDRDESLVGRVFLRDRLVVVASPDVRPSADGSPIPTVVRGKAEMSETWTVSTATGKSRLAVRPCLSLSSLLMVRDAVRMGVGAAQLPISLVSHDLAAGTLVDWGELEGPEITLWVLYPSRRLLSARVSAFLDHLRVAFPNGTPDELARYVVR